MNLIINDLHLDTVEVRRERRQGREYLVVPLVAAREIVMNRALYLSEELAKTAFTLNNAPITIGHPDKPAGELPSLETFGVIKNAYVENKKLKAEAWFDIELLLRAGNRGKLVMDKISRKEPIEVSTGLLANEIAKSGTFGGKEYTRIIENIHHDHLAILLDTQGACSIDDGCGLVRNESEEVSQAASIIDKALAALGISQSKETKPMAEEKDTQEPVYDDSAVLAAIEGLKQSFDTQVQELDGRINDLIANQAKVEKAPIVARLIANERCPLEEDSLTAMPICDLKKLEASYKPKDYSGNGGSFYANVDEDNFKYVEVE